jgi:hypothetical protein
MTTINELKSTAFKLFRKLVSVPSHYAVTTRTIKKAYPKFDGRKKENWVLLIFKLLDRTATGQKKSDKAMQIFSDVSKHLSKFDLCFTGNIHPFLSTISRNIKLKAIHDGKYFFNAVLSINIDTKQYGVTISRSREVLFDNINDAVNFIIRKSPATKNIFPAA